MELVAVLVAMGIVVAYIATGERKSFTVEPTKDKPHFSRSEYLKKVKTEGKEREWIEKSVAANKERVKKNYL